MDKIQQYCQTLGVQIGATPEEIKLAYRKLSKTCHPDSPSGDVIKFQALNEAKEYLDKNGTKPKPIINLMDEANKAIKMKEAMLKQMEEHAKDIRVRAGVIVYAGVITGICLCGTYLFSGITSVVMAVLLLGTPISLLLFGDRISAGRLKHPKLYKFLRLTK
jgi:hypothetical protein